ncbi:MAG: hypothetical protein WED07_08625 [Candidatus Freyarchaeum deiterrae]
MLSTMKMAERWAAATIALLAVSIITLAYHSTKVYWYTSLTLALTLGPTPTGILSLAVLSAYPAEFSIGVNAGIFAGFWYKLLLDLAYLAPVGVALFTSLVVTLCYSLREFPGCETADGIVKRINQIITLGEERDQMEATLALIVIPCILMSIQTYVYALTPVTNPLNPLILVIILALNLLTTYNFGTSIGRIIQREEVIR